MTLARAAGGLLWRSDPDGPRIAIVHRSRRGDWSIPKGRLDAGERWEEAALREVQEETGCSARLVSFAGATSSMAGRRPKVVLYWHMALVREGKLECGDEIDEVKWLRPREALLRLDAASDRRLLARSPPGGLARRGRSASGLAAVAALRASLLRRGLALQPGAVAAAIGPALELLDEADQVAASGDGGELSVLLLAARWLAMLSSAQPSRARLAAALRGEARRLARRRRRVVRVSVSKEGPDEPLPAERHPAPAGGAPPSSPDAEEPRDELAGADGSEEEGDDAIVLAAPPEGDDELLGEGEMPDEGGEASLLQPYDGDAPLAALEPPPTGTDAPSPLLDRVEPPPAAAPEPARDGAAPDRAPPGGEAAARHVLRRAARRAALAVSMLALVALVAGGLVGAPRADLALFAAAGLIGGAAVAALALRSAAKAGRGRGR